MNKKIQENLGTLITVITIVGVALGAWFKMGETFTPIEKHQQLTEKVQQVVFRNEKTRLQNDLRWFEFQYRTNCRTASQRRTDNCQWMASEIEKIKLELLSVR